MATAGAFPHSVRPAVTAAGLLPHPGLAAGRGVLECHVRKLALVAALSACGGSTATDPATVVADEQQAQAQAQAQTQLMETNLQPGQEAFELPDGGWSVQTPGSTCSVSGFASSLPCCPGRETVSGEAGCSPCYYLSQCSAVYYGSAPQSGACSKSTTGTGSPVCGEPSLSCCPN